jgi:hypothetical protein
MSQDTPPNSCPYCGEPDPQENAQARDDSERCNTPIVECRHCHKAFFQGQEPWRHPTRRERIARWEARGWSACRRGLIWGATAVLIVVGILVGLRRIDPHALVLLMSAFSVGGILGMAHRLAALSKRRRRMRTAV